VYLLDTNIVSELVRRTPNPKVVARLHREAATDLLLSSITVFELRFGAARSAKPASLWGRIQHEILSRFRVIGFDQEDAVAAADVLSPLVGAGQNIAVQDVMLAGMALRCGFTMVTRNRRHFDRATGLQVENWFE